MVCAIYVQQNVEEIEMLNLVELNDKNKAITLKIEGDRYYIEAINSDEMSLSFKYITSKDINQIIYSK